MLSHILYMEALYNKLYGDSSWRELQKSRKVPHMYYRHIVRYFMYHGNEDLSFNLVAAVEGRVLGKPPVSHDSIMNSVEAVENGLIKTEYFQTVLHVKETLEEEYFKSIHYQVAEGFSSLLPSAQKKVFLTLLSKGAVDYHSAKTLIEAHQNINPKNPQTVEQHEIIYTEDQQKALQEIEDWLYSEPEGPEDLYKTLSGYAGTGKTTLLNEIVQNAEDHFRRVGVTATTNKAVKVLVDRVKASNYSTIHSVLNIKPQQVGTKEIFKPDRYNNSFSLSDYNFIVVDEASMISSVDDLDPESGDVLFPSLLTLIKEENKGYTKVLFCGDPAQAEPIGEGAISKVFDFSSSTLTEVVRHGDIISSKAKLVRDTDQYVDKNILLHPPEIEQVNKTMIWNEFKGFRENPDRIRMLCYTNDQVDYWNEQLRLADYGEPTEHPFTPGDVVIANKPCTEGKDIIMMNSEEGIVEAVADRTSYYYLTVALYNGTKAKVRVVKKEFKDELSETLAMLAGSEQWQKYWKLRKHYHDIKHCYALTTHKSQGSTFDNVVLDWQNLQTVRQTKNRNQLIYVGMTRAAEKVMIL